MLCQTIATIWVKVVLGVTNAASQQTLLLSPAPPSNPMLGGVGLNAMADHC